nr:hypothetical protein [uncultured Brevundimonas sp.]
MKRSFNLSGLCLSALIAPGLSLIFVLVAALGLAILDWVMSASDAGVSLASAGHAIVTLAAMILLVTLWGLLPSIMFGAAGCWVAERYLRSKAWWVWVGARRTDHIGGLCRGGGGVWSTVFEAQLSLRALAFCDGTGADVQRQAGLALEPDLYWRCRRAPCSGLRGRFALFPA